MITQKWQLATRALTCLYVTVDESVANDVIQKVNAAHEEDVQRIIELSDAYTEMMNLAAAERGRAIAAEAEVLRLQNAIRSHRDARGDDRCWLDDEELYKLLPEGYTPPARDTTVELRLCEAYIKNRHNPHTIYISPQRRIEELEQELQAWKDSATR